MSPSKNKLARNLYLIGFMGVGKSVVGRAVSRRLNMHFHDSDWAIERKEGRSISEIFKTDGEAHFRSLERSFIEDGHPSYGQVVSCGGGLPIAEGMSDLLTSKGIVVCLFARPETILKRTIGNPKRPLLQVEDPYTKIKELLEEREPLYLSVGIGVSTEGRGIRDIVDNVYRVYKRENARFNHSQS